MLFVCSHLHHENIRALLNRYRNKSFSRTQQRQPPFNIDRRRLSTLPSLKDRRTNQEAEALSSFPSFLLVHCLNKYFFLTRPLSNCQTAHTCHGHTFKTFLFFLLFIVCLANFYQYTYAFVCA